MIEITERPGSAEIRVETQEGVMLSAIPALRLTAGLQGVSGLQGPAGPQGPQGVPGPNLVNTST
jgi:hypothetical protein